MPAPPKVSAPVIPRIAIAFRMFVSISKVGSANRLQTKTKGCSPPGCATSESVPRRINTVPPVAVSLYPTKTSPNRHLCDVTECGRRRGEWLDPVRARTVAVHAGLILGQTPCSEQGFEWPGQ